MKSTKGQDGYPFAIRNLFWGVYLCEIAQSRLQKGIPRGPNRPLTDPYRAFTIQYYAHL